MTLVEILIVLVIIGLAVGGVVGGTGQLASARLKRAATLVAGGVRLSYTRATARSRSVRIVFDLDEQKLWVEEGDLPMLVQSTDASGTGGADPATEAEKAALEAKREILEGPKVARAQFKAVSLNGFDDGDAEKGVRSLGRGIRFRSVQTSHDDDPHTTGRAYLYFWPGGQTERASIQVSIGKTIDDDKTLTLVVAPLTGRVTIASGAVELPIPRDDAEASERVDSSW